MARGNKGCDMKIVGLMATHGRHYYCERSVGMFLNQSHENKHLVILQNSSTPQKLDKEYSNITLVNEHNFNNLGEIYNRMLDFVPADADLICIFDDDDIFLPNHFSEGELGFIRGRKKAYKPERSYFWCGNDVKKISNVLETSWFIDANVIRKTRFRNESKKQHFNWIDWVIENQQVYVDSNGKSTMACVWGNQEHPLYHSSGDPTERNFENFRSVMTDHGDQVITPWSGLVLDGVYKKFNNLL